MQVEDMESLNAESGTFYRAALQKLIDAELPFLVGGAYALQVHTGIVRRTKDFDIFMLKKDAKQALKLLSEAGYRAEVVFPHWIGKVFSGDEFIDVIFSSGNGYCRVDKHWFDHAAHGKVLGIEMALCPAEETIWQKSFILERDRCDVADVAHLLRHCGARLDWKRLIKRFGDCWPVLLAQLILFQFVYPGHRDAVPAWVFDELIARRQQEAGQARAGDKECFGTLLSATQYLRDIDMEGYHDARLPPHGHMNAEEIEVWTANFMQPK
jgi:hypothetical protein